MLCLSSSSLVAPPGITVQLPIYIYSNGEFIGYDPGMGGGYYAWEYRPDGFYDIYTGSMEKLAKPINQSIQSWLNQQTGRVAYVDGGSTYINVDPMSAEYAYLISSKRECYDYQPPTNRQSICPNIKVKGKTTLAYIDKNKVKTPTRADLECVDASEFIQGSQKGKCPTIKVKGGIRYNHRMKVKTPTKTELNCE